MQPVIGHEAIIKNINQLLEKDNLPNTLLFSGPSGTGKALLARHLGKALFCSTKLDMSTENSGTFGQCNDCNHCKVFEAGNMPDYYFIQCKDRENWNTAAIRSLLSSLNLKALSASKRVVIFDNAEEMPVQAANALLKILEEPKASLYFILVSGNRSRLPTTIVSRSQNWHFNHLSSDDFARVLANIEGFSELSPDELCELGDLAERSVVRAKKIMQAEEFFNESKHTLNLIAGGMLSEGLKFAKAIAANKDELNEQLDLLRLIVRHNMRNATSADLASRWALALQDLVLADYYINERNLSANYYLSNVFQRLARSDNPVSLSNDPPGMNAIVVN